jgi:hypothetical protein
MCFPNIRKLPLGDGLMYDDRPMYIISAHLSTNLLQISNTTEPPTSPSSPSIKWNVMQQNIVEHFYSKSQMFINNSI